MKHTRIFYKLICVVLCAVMLVPLAGCGETRETQREVYAMDTVMTLTAYGKQADAGLTAAESIILSMERRSTLSLAQARYTPLTMRRARERSYPGKSPR